MKLTDVKPWINLNHLDLTYVVQTLPKLLAGVVSEGRLMIAGGFIRSVIVGEKVNDIDVFATSEEAAHDGANRYYDLADFEDVIATDNAFTVVGKEPAVQFIHKWTFDTPGDLIRSFDFTICCAAIFTVGSEWRSICHRNYYEDLAAKRLTYLNPSGSQPDVGSLLRALKFVRMGYQVPHTTLANLLAGISTKIPTMQTHEVADYYLKLLEEGRGGYRP